MRRFLMLLFLGVFLVVQLDGADIQFSGLAQAWFSYADQAKDDGKAYGFTVRRVRIYPHGLFSEKIKWGLRVGWDEQEASLLDVYLDFLVNRNFNIKLGQFAPPAAISAGLTADGELDFIERPVITLKWGDHSRLFSWRALGLQVYGQLMADKVQYAFMVANPRALELFSPSIRFPEYEHPGSGLTFWGRLEIRPMAGLNFGAFFGTGTEKEVNNKKSSYGAHLFYVHRPLNLKLEYIAGEYGLEGQGTRYNGIYAIVGIKIKKSEYLVRYGFYTPNNGAPNRVGVKRFNNITFGINYFYNQHIKFQTNYVIRRETMAEGIDQIENNVFYINCQYSF